LTHDQPRRVAELHAVDCPCCSDDPARLDVRGIALRFLVGLGWGVIFALILDAVTGGPGLAVMLGGAA